MRESLSKVYQNLENQIQSEFFNADKTFLKLLRAFHSLHCFYNKARESCIYMLGLYYNLQDYKYDSHINIGLILNIEKYLLTLVLAETKTFENPERYNFYIKENDIYEISRKRRSQNEDMNEIEDDGQDFTEEMVKKLFALNAPEGKYIVRLKDIEAYSSINEAQLRIFEK